MNISSASKKVLCTALSAATALAFTPAVAFGAIDGGTAVKVTFNLNGGKVNGDMLVGSDTGIGYVEAKAGEVDIPATYAKSDNYKLYHVAKGTQVYYYDGVALNDYVVLNHDVEGDWYSDDKGTAVTDSDGVVDYYVLPSNRIYYTKDAGGSSPGEVGYIPLPGDAVYKRTGEAVHFNNGLNLRGTDAMKAGVAAKGGNAIAGWFVDADGDGVKDAGETAVVDGILDVSGDDVSGSDIELTAYYAEPALEPTLQATSVTGTMAVSAATLNATGLEAYAKYDAELTFPDGTSVTAPSTVPAEEDGTATFDFGASLDGVKGNMTAGEYTFSVRRNSNGETVATGTAELVTVKLDAGGYGSFGRNAVTEFVATPGVTVTLGDENKPSTDGGYPLSGWTDGENSYGADSITVYANAELTAVYAVPQVDGIGFEGYYNCTVANGELEFSAKNLADAGDTGEYTATITGPEGFSKTIDVTVAGGATSGNLKFGEAWETADEVTEELTAGTYTVTIELEAVDGKELTKDQEEQGAVAGSVELAPISYELDGGSWDAAVGTAELPTLAAVGSKMYGYGDGSDEPANYVLDGEAFTAPEGMEFDCVTVNGVKSNEIAGETVPASGVTVAAVWKAAAATQAAAPEVTFEEAEDGSYTASVTAAEGTRAYYKIDSGSDTAVPDDGTVTLGDATELTVWSVDLADTLGDSDCTVYTPAATTIDELKAFGDAVADGLTSASAKNAPVRYGDEIEGLGEAAVEAAEAKAWGSASEWKALTDEQERAILEQAVEVEENNLEALTQPKLSEDGETYTYVSAADAAKASEALALVLADFNGLRSGDHYEAKSTTDGTEPVTDDANDYIKAIAYAVSSAERTTVGSADAAAAAAVDALIQALPEVTDDNYEAAIEAADEAIAAYEALSDAAKALVTEDVEKTHEVKIAALEKKVAAAEKAAEQAKADAAAEQAKAQKELEEAEAALVAEQDHASALQVKGKTKAVKANKKTKKTKKAVSYTIVAEQSPSGAVATFSTVSKTSKVKVSGAKVTLKKGAKKGKTYSAKVKVSYGNASNTVTVKFKVK